MDKLEFYVNLMSELIAIHVHRNRSWSHERSRKMGKLDGMKIFFLVFVFRYYELSYLDKQESERTTADKAGRSSYKALEIKPQRKL